MKVSFGRLVAVIKITLGIAAGREEKAAGIAAEA
jgi:hypothetical protein